MRALITGINGFVGPWVAAELLRGDPDIRIWGMAWGDAGREPLAELEGPRLEVVDGDLSDPPSLAAVLDRARPEVVLHLAAASSVAGSWTSPARVLEINAVGQVHLFEALLASAAERPRVVVASSAEVYGRVPQDRVPVTEDAPLEPVSPYGVSKAVQDLLARQYHVAHGLDTVRLRLFNHTGPRRPPHFFASGFARQIADIERGRRPSRIAVGDLEVVRDLTDVRDVARAWRLAALHGASGEVYNVCSGRAVKVGEVLHRLLALAGTEIEVEGDPALLRSADVPVLVGDPSRFARATGWSPSIPLERTLADLLDWWRGQAS